MSVSLLLSSLTELLKTKTNKGSHSEPSRSPRVWQRSRSVSLVGKYNCRPNCWRQQTWGSSVLFTRHFQLERPACTCVWSRWTKGRSEHEPVMIWELMQHAGRNLYRLCSWGVKFKCHICCLNRNVALVCSCPSLVPSCCQICCYVFTMWLRMQPLQECKDFKSLEISDAAKCVFSEVKLCINNHNWSPAPVSVSVLPFSWESPGHHELWRGEREADQNHVVTERSLAQEVRRGQRVHQEPGQIHRQQSPVWHLLCLWQHPLLQGADFRNTCICFHLINLHINHKELMQTVIIKIIQFSFL